MLGRTVSELMVTERGVLGDRAWALRELAQVRSLGVPGMMASTGLRAVSLPCEKRGGSSPANSSSPLSRPRPAWLSWRRYARRSSSTCDAAPSPAGAPSPTRRWRWAQGPGPVKDSCRRRPGRVVLSCQDDDRHRRAGNPCPAAPARRQGTHPRRDSARRRVAGHRGRAGGPAGREPGRGDRHEHERPMHALRLPGRNSSWPVIRLPRANDRANEVGGPGRPGLPQWHRTRGGQSWRARQ